VGACKVGRVRVVLVGIAAAGTLGTCGGSGGGGSAPAGDPGYRFVCRCRRRLAHARAL